MTLASASFSRPRSDHFVTRQGCRTMRINIAISAALNALHIQQDACLAHCDMNHSKSARHCGRPNRIALPQNLIDLSSGYEGTGTASTHSLFSRAGRGASVGWVSPILPTVVVLCLRGMIQILFGRRRIALVPLDHGRQALIGENLLTER
jgi:hypothetical protein